VAGWVRPDLSTGSNPGGKAAAIVAAMAAGADSIDGLDVLRHGGMGRLFGGVYAPSTLGSFLRFFTWGHSLQLEAAARDLLAALAARTPLLPGAATLTYVDVDSLLRRVYGPAKQGAAFGHAKVGGYQVRLRGLSPLVAAISTPQAAPVPSSMRTPGAGSPTPRPPKRPIPRSKRAPTGSPRGSSCVRFASSIPHQPVKKNCSRSGGITRS
jgi:hypothetical protein